MAAKSFVQHFNNNNNKGTYNADFWGLLFWKQLELSEPFDEQKYITVFFHIMNHIEQF